MIDIEAEVNKHRNKDRAELEKRIQEYKNLARQYATNLSLAGEYSAVAQKLKDICDKLPPPNLTKHQAGRVQSAPSKTANITSEEQAKISEDWKKRTKDK